MAIPRVDWDIWKAPTIAPTMRAVIHFLDGPVEYTDSDIVDVSFDINAFDTSSVLFGKPVPSSGSIAFMDYEQKLNPTLNKGLIAGLKVELFLGLKGFYSEDQYGPNLVKDVDPNEQVYYGNDLVWAIPFHTTEVLERSDYYLLEFDFVDPDGSEGHVEQTGTVEELFRVPTYWPDYTYFAIVYPSNITISNLSVRHYDPIEAPYGIFYTQEWSYDSSGHEATVDIIDSMDALLTTDTRIDGDAPGANTSLRDFLVNLVSVSEPEVLQNINDVQSLYVFYESTQAASINGMVEALMAMAFYLPDGSLALSHYAGLYDTGVTLTDEDIYSYSIQQTSAVSIDSAIVTAMLPESVESTELLSYSNIILDSGDTVPYSASRIMSVDYMTSECSQDIMPMYSWDVASFQFTTFTGASVTLNSLKVYGHAIAASALPISNIVGTAPYEVKDNYYIQSKDHAQAMVNKIDSFIDLVHRTIEISLRGCYGFWPGAILTISSERYNIEAKYVIIGLNFSYTGPISTTLTLQRVLQ